MLAATPGRDDGPDPGATDGRGLLRRLSALGWDDLADPAARELLARAAASTPPAMLALNSTVLSPRGFLPRLPDPGRTGVVVAPLGETETAAPHPGPGRYAEPVPVPPGPLLGGEQLRVLRQLAVVQLDVRQRRGPLEAAALVIALSLAGVPLVTSGLPEEVRLLVDGSLLAECDAVMASPTPEAGERELLSIRVRRRAHAVYGYRPPGDVDDPPVSVLVVDDGDRKATQRLLAEVDAQTWPARQVHVVAPDTDPAVTAAAVTAAGARYVTMMSPRLAYGPHHLEDLVRALAHSGAGVVHSPARFEVDERLGAVVEHCGEAGEADGGPGLVGGSLWYAADGLDVPVATGYRVHGANAVPRSRAGSVASDRLSGTLVHRRLPAVLPWLPEGLRPPGPPVVPPSYFAAAARS